MISVALKGLPGWRRNAAGARQVLSREARAATTRVAQSTLEWLQRQISSRALSLAPLSEAYEARKPADAPILVLTREYVSSFIVRQTSNGAVVDLKTEALQTRAKWLEYGTETMPPRPHWRPASDHARTVIGPVQGRVVLTRVASALAGR